jgi:hypothetical protein
MKQCFIDGYRAHRKTKRTTLQGRHSSLVDKIVDSREQRQKEETRQSRGQRTEDRGSGAESRQERAESRQQATGQIERRREQTTSAISTTRSSFAARMLDFCFLSFLVPCEW